MDENTLAYLVVIVIFILFSVIRNTRQSSGGSGRGGKNARIVYSREPDLERTRGLFGMAEQKLEKAGLTVFFQDERLSTVAAEDALLEGDLSRAERKRKVDKVAAAVFLQEYLDSMR